MLIYPDSSDLINFCADKASIDFAGSGAKFRRPVPSCSGNERPTPKRTGIPKGLLGKNASSVILAELSIEFRASI